MAKSTDKKQTEYYIVIMSDEIYKSVVGEDELQREIKDLVEYGYHTDEMKVFDSSKGLSVKLIFQFY